MEHTETSSTGITVIQKRDRETQLSEALERAQSVNDNRIRIRVMLQLYDASSRVYRGWADPWLLQLPLAAAPADAFYDALSACLKAIEQIGPDATCALLTKAMRPVDLDGWVGEQKA